jgi:predicted acetyltransferase
VTFEVRPCADADELRDAVYAIGQYFGWKPGPEDVERIQRVLPLERMLGAREDGRVVGGAGAFPFELSVPGGSLRCGGVSVVGVFPTHRRRGVLRAMMRRQLDDLHAWGEPLAALWASEETIYGRFGYGCASLVGSIELARDRSAFALPFDREGTLRLVEAEEVPTLFAPVWERVRAQTPGMHGRPEAWWRDRIVYDPPERRGGAGPKRFVVHENDDGVHGYAIYRHQTEFEHGVSVGTLVIVEAIAATPAATRDLWRFLFDIDFAAKATATLLPPDHPLWFLLAEPRRMRYRMGDGLWVRLVDVGAALSGRTYDGEGAVVFDIADSFCPWNEGRWKLEGGVAARTRDDADLRLDVSALGSAYLGGFSFRELARGLRVEEVRPGALARADSLFQTPVHPWPPEIF